MTVRLRTLTLATTAAILWASPGGILLGQKGSAATDAVRRAIVIPETENVHTKAVLLESYRPLPHKGYGLSDKGAGQPSQMYSFVLHGTAQPSVVAIEVLDSSGTVVQRTTGKLTGKGGEGRPREGTSQRQYGPMTFKILGFTPENSVVRIDKLVAGMKLTITGDKGWAIVTTLGKISKKG